MPVWGQKIIPNPKRTSAQTMRFSRFAKRSRVFIDAARDTVGTAAVLLASKKLEFDGYDGPTVVDAIEFLIETMQPADIQVFVRAGGISQVVVVRTHLLPVFDKVVSSFNRTDFFMSWNGKPLSVTSNPVELGITSGSTIVCTFRQRGGMHTVRRDLERGARASALAPPKLVLPAGNTLDTERVMQRALSYTARIWTPSFGDAAKEFQYTREYMDAPRYDSSLLVGMKKGDSVNLVSQRLKKRARGKRANFELQAVEFDPMELLSQHADPAVVSFVEDVTLLCIQLLRAKSMCDRVIAVSVFIKLRTGSSLVFGVSKIVSDVLHDVFSHQLQVDEESLLDTVTDLRSLLSSWEAIKESSMVQQVMRVYKYAVALGAFALVGVKIDEKVAYMCKKEVSSPLMGFNFLTTLLDTVALFLQRALLYKKTGSWATFVHGPSNFGKWFDACQKLKREYQFRGDLESQGTSYHQFMAEMQSCLSEGESILKYGTTAAGYELTNIKRTMNDLNLMRAEISTFREAQKSRRPPFALLVHGKTCVGKSTFTSMLYQYAGKVMGLPTSDEFRYTRNTCDDFWSGWDSMKWFLLLDDIAFTHPDGKIVDNSLNEVIQIMNDVPLVPNQASLEDKGKNPVRARMCVATTNTKHLNAFAYFACPIAVQRRFPFVLTVTPKPEYARDDDPEMIDPAKLPPIDGDWPDFWIVEVERVVAHGSSQASYETVHTFNTVKPFLRWLSTTIRAFESIQSRARSGIEAMQQISICRACCENTSECICELVAEYALQAAKYSLPSGKALGESFDQEVSDGEFTERSRFVPSQGGSSAYTKTTTVFHNGIQVRKYASPVEVVTECAVQSDSEADQVAMADVLAEIIRQQRNDCPSIWIRGTHWCVEKYLGAYMRSRAVRSVTHYVMEWSLCRRFVLWGFQRYTSNNSHYYKWLGDVIQSCYMSRKWRYVLYGLGAVSAAVVAFGVFRGTKSDTEVQVLRQPVSDDAFPRSEKVNVWKRDDYETSSFDRTPMNVSFASLPHDQIMKIVERNVARIKVSDGLRAREGNVFSPCGHLWMTNNHTLLNSGDLEVTLSVTPHTQGASSNVTMRLTQADILRFPDRDLAFFEVFSWETKRDLRSLIRKPSLRGAYTATYVTRDKRVATKLTKVRCASLIRMHVAELDTDLDLWTGSADVATTVGDCGSPMVTHQPVSCILGIHTLGNPSGTVWAAAVDSDIVEAALKHFATPVVQCGTPVISAPSREKSLGPLRQKSPLRWLEAGTIRVYGSYVGQGPTSRSKVKPTLLSEQILRERGWELNYAAPDLRDWRPWRFALVDSTQKQFGALSPSIMKEIARAYADDVLEALRGSEVCLEPLSHKATINGIPGVRFIDKMNFKSSMGEPYNKSKKYFLSGVEGNQEFDQEILDRIAHVEACYERGQRACPVFSGQLKDEARAKNKVAQGKVRVFTAAPADWSYVVRKYLLPFVKLMQEHPFVFESSPGCTVQSLEWQQYYVFLTHFGLDRNVCGDYGKFDKRAEALIILLAFQVIKRVYAAFGWTEEQLVIIDCIAEDTAYAFVNFDGDLLEFLGSNPSGHPLTVIINCIINALYMRFAFVDLHPVRGDTYSVARQFKSLVHLLTYGDDNAMNVSRDADWFNHTAIQSSMARIGVEYTMADKESDSRPFIGISEVSYLKRRWRWDEDIGAVVAPLEEDSIRKMLTICLPSGTESPELHMASVMVSAINEWFWYGKDVFERERAWLLDLAERNGLLRELTFKGFPTYQELVDRFWAASSHIKAEIGCESEHPRSVLPN